MRLRFRSLESRIVTLFLLLIVAIQLAAFVVINKGIDENARGAIREELAVGKRLFSRLLDQNAQKLTQGARLLASDFGFRSAITTDGGNDRETIVSTLANHGARINASLTMYIDAERKVVAATSAHPSPSLERTALGMLDRADQTDGANGMAIVGNLPYQVVVVPVRAPVTIGWIVMAFPIDKAIADEMYALSRLHMTVLARTGTGNWISGASTLPAAQVPALVEQLRTLRGDARDAPEVSLAGADYQPEVMGLAREGEHVVSVVLLRSISEAVAPYTLLKTTLLVLTAVGILLAFIGSLFTAKRIAQPLRQLTDSARLLGRGEYAAQVDVKRDDEIGELANAFDSMRRDIAKREQEIRTLAYWDPLTNLPNRAQFVTLLDGAIASANQSGAPFAVLMMDLDRFKHVNDVLGHSFGDALLAKVAERIRGQVQAAGGTVARLGGDEFTVLLPQALLGDAQTVAARILQALEQPMSLEDQTVDLGAGLGIACYPVHGENAEQLLSVAEVAMYAAKQRRDGAVVYDPRLDKASQQSLSLLSELRSAIENNEFRLHVQPKISLATGKVVGAEALVRWMHPERGQVFPDHFIPFAEQTGFIRVLTRWVLEQSAALCRSLNAQGVFIKLSVNLSTRDLLDQDLPNKFAEILKQHQVVPGSFCLEITESAIMDDPLRAQTTLEGLHAMGVDLSIDDFGTGYSSLAYLKRLPVDELKIDKSFVLNLEKDADDTKIVRSTIDLGHNLGLRVVAEGIESEAVWHLLARLGCDQGQGYFMSKPMPADQLAGWLDGWQAPAAAPQSAVQEA
jgi:diguanylate cyclase (GGDEF)-like protein